MTPLDTACFYSGAADDLYSLLLEAGCKSRGAEEDQISMTELEAEEHEAEELEAEELDVDELESEDLEEDELMFGNTTYIGWTFMHKPAKSDAAAIKASFGEYGRDMDASAAIGFEAVHVAAEILLRFS